MMKRIISWPVTAGRSGRVARVQYSTRASMDNYEIVDFSSLSETVQNLIRQAVEIRKRAYIPYSNFAVGSAVLTEEDLKVYTGCNVENMAHSPSICAERVAVPKAVCDGYLKLKMIAVVAHQETSFTAPCGVCRQTLSEFRGSNGDIDVYLSKPVMDKVLVTKLSKLLPLSFVRYTEDGGKS
ncbi:cytidine deaminase-like [Pectinophora gossypiella]|uniref:cytidine deaminase-like n=1 Tax=Pectinophora gossypiella TaxID=13191 RepID=UPI00214E1ECA|nr:cytidine deaminase-like [Pectinophora gossypiella]